MGVIMRLQFLLAAAICVSGTASMAQMTDCAYKSRFFGSNATLKVEGGKPVAYWTDNYTAKSVTKQGDTILIDQARLSSVVHGKTQDGKWAIQGNWKLGKHSKDNVVFVCAP